MDWPPKAGFSTRFFGGRDADVLPIFSRATKMMRLKKYQPNKNDGIIYSFKKATCNKKTKFKG